MIHRIIQPMIMVVLAIWLAATFAFFALRLLPGDPIQAQLSPLGYSEEAIAERRAQLGLNEPLSVQYGRFLVGLLQGDMGYSLTSYQPVNQLIAQRLPSTIELASAAMSLAILLGFTLGIIGGLNIRYFSFLARGIVILSFSMPIYVTGTLIVFIVATQLAGRENLILPASVLGFHTAGAIARHLQNAIHETVQADFVRTARSKGLTDNQVTIHILRVSLIPVVTIIALQAGVLFSGTVITESIFLRPGLGTLLLDATLRQDYPVVQGIVVLSAVVYLITNVFAELSYGLLDPRLRLAE